MNEWFWIIAVASLFLIFWPQVVLRKAEIVRQEDLVASQANFDQLNKLYLTGVVIALSASLLVVAALLGFVTLNAPLPATPLVAAAIVIVLLWVGFSRGYVGVRSGVYPVSKWFARNTLYYRDSEGSRLIRKVGYVQIIMAIGGTLIFMLGLTTYILL